MKDELNEMLDSLALLRTQAFNDRNEPLYKLLGRAMNGLIQARDLVK